MNNNEINTAIKYLNEALQSNVLDSVKYDINLNVIASIIDKKKNNAKKILYLNINQTNKISSQKKKSVSLQNKSESYELNNKSESTATTPINDSITVSNFKVPSELFIPTSNTSNDTWKTLTNPHEV
jgi:hypothetical protein